MIYTITMIQKINLEQYKENADFLPTFGDYHCVGYFSSLKEAIYAVDDNLKDIHDEIYQYCIIEEVPEGIYKKTKRRYLFEWNGSKYIQISDLIINNVTNFSIG